MGKIAVGGQFPRRLKQLTPRCLRKFTAHSQIAACQRFAESLRGGYLCLSPRPEIKPALAFVQEGTYRGQSGPLSIVKSEHNTL